MILYAGDGDANIILTGETPKRIKVAIRSSIELFKIKKIKIMIVICYVTKFN